MKKINRHIFLKKSLQAGGALMLASMISKSLANEFANEVKMPLTKDEELFKRLLSANDKQVAALLQSDFSKTAFSRHTGFEFAVLTASYCCNESEYYHNTSVAIALKKIVQLLSQVQAKDGTVNIGNLESPPDTAFLLEPLVAATAILLKEGRKSLPDVKEALRGFITKAADALVTGGVHTPNHRWVICAALAQINTVYPSKKYNDRIEDWLGEGIFIDKDGHYPERSMTYSAVENNSLITMSRLLNKPALLEPVRRNLDLTYYYMEPNGDLVTTDSRRQDQYTWGNILHWYLLYRYMAIKDGNGKFAAIARLIEGMKGFEENILSRSLFYFLENPILQKELPESGQLPVSFEKLFATSHLLRIRRGNTTTTFFGGVDWPLTIASGRSNSPNFFSYRSGDAVLKYMRLSTGFFSTGYFYSEGLKKSGDQYLLHKKLEVPYYQPLPKNLRKKDGDYQLSPSIDDRFWNKMDFRNRPVTNVKTLEIKVSLKEKNGTCELNIDVSGQTGVPVTIELCFKEGGELSGVIEASGENNFLEKGMGTYSYGKDVIQFGPGAVRHKSITDLEGERYSTHFGSLRTKGMHVYLTGVTPFTHALNFMSPASGKS